MKVKNNMEAPRLVINWKKLFLVGAYILICVHNIDKVISEKMESAKALP